ncbi:hypothetical protein MJH12_08350, partial [bacterium]|nr:hypothetical protein [bacterium]
MVPDNDNFDSATLLAGLSDTVSANNTLASTEVGEPSHDQLQTENSLWWKISPTQNVYLEFKTSGSEFDTILSVYTGSQINELTTIASNDQSVNSSSLITDSSLVRFHAQGGKTYFIAVSGMEDEIGQITLNYRSVIAQVPNNDHFAEALVLTTSSGQSSVGILDATTEAGEPDHLFLSPQRTVWYKWEVPQSMLASLDTSGTGFNTIMSVYNGHSLTSLVELASNDDGFLDGSSQVVLPVNAGDILYIAIAAIDTGQQITFNYGPNNQQPIENNLFINAFNITNRAGEFSTKNQNAWLELGE